ncbi:MAG: FtsX-like permease family protein [Bacteroidia bacterium]|nr:FtsX-like permease family protein [Bacteroidia bacterium]
MLFNIAWRNVWRHPVRSGIVMTAIALGLWSGIAMMAFSWGISESRTRDVIQTQTSHLQVHARGYEAGEEMQFFLPDTDIQQEIMTLKGVVKTSGRILANGMLESTKGNFGVQIRGVDPEEEAAMTGLRDRMIGGEYFPESSRPIAIIGEELARSLGVIEDTASAVMVSEGPQAPTFNFRRNLVIRFQDINGEMTSSKFKVAGVYTAQNVNLEKSQVFVKASDLQQMVGNPGGIQEIAVMLDDIQHTDAVIATISASHPELEAKSWSKLAPELEFMASSFDSSMRIFIGVILLALAFGIINTMLMAVMERTRELGMLMSIGMTKPKVFSMIMMETVLLTLIGAPIGLLAGWGFTKYFGRAGIDLSQFEKGMDSYGISSIVYPDLPSGYYTEIVIMVVITALLSAIYPALRALKLNPAEAVRAI